MFAIKSHLRKLCTEISKNSKFPLPLALIIEAFSSLQLIHIIQASTFDVHNIKYFPFSGFFRDITSYTGAIEVFDKPVSAATVQTIWIISIVYVTLHIIGLVALLIMLRKKESFVKEMFFKVMGIVYPLHSRIVFFAIQYFLVTFIRAYVECEDDEEGLFYCKQNVVLVTGLICALNTLLAAMVEIYFYDINKVKNSYAIKTNALHQLELFHKLLAIFTYVLLQGLGYIPSMGAIVHILLTLASSYFIYTKLPFYKTLLLRVKVAIMGVTMACSIILIIRTFSVDITLLEIPWVMANVLIVKVYLVMFNYELKTILEGKIDKPERAIHFAILLKEYNFGHICPTTHKRMFPRNSVITNGILGLNTRDRKTLSEKDTQEIDQEMYMHILERLTVSLNKHPNSVPLALFMARIYLKKLENIPQAVGLIKKVSELSLSVPLKSSVEEFTYLLKKLYSDQYLNSDQSLNLISYFTYRKIANDMKASILTEVKRHIEFWTEIKREAVDVKRMFDIAREINDLSHKSELMFAQNQQGFSKTLANSLQLYRIYIEKVRELPHESAKLMKNFLTIRHNQMLRHPLDVCSEEKAVVVLSLQKDHVGFILDASGSIQTLFNVEKSKIIGGTLNSFLPGAFTKHHIQFIQNYAKVLTHKLDHKIKTFGKTKEGELFELNMHMQLYPEIEKEVKMMILFEKLTGPQSIVIVDRDGFIVDYSESVKACFFGGVISIGNKVQTFSPEYDVVNSAFNLVYAGSTKKKLKERKSPSLTKKKSLKVTSGSGADAVKALHEVLNNKVTLDNDALDMEKAKQICNTYSIGARLVFENSRYASEEGDDVQIEPYFHDNSVYKVITIKPPEENNKILNKIETEVELKKTDALSDIFADDFPEDDEGIYPPGKAHRANRRDYRYTTDATNPVLIGGRTSANREVTNLSITKFTFPNDEKLSSKRLDSSVGNNHPDDMSVTDEKGEKGKTTRPPTSMQPAKAGMAQREQSVTSYLTSGLETIKALRRIFDQRSAYPLTRNSLIVVTLVIAFMVGLATVFYTFSQQSIVEHQQNIQIINIANQRLAGSIKSWQYAARYHLINLHLSFEDVVFVTASLASSAKEMLDRNNELNQLLATSLSNERLEDIFKGDIYLWEPCKEATANGGSVNSFAATSMIFNLLNSLDDEPKSCPDLLGGDEMLFVLNNTANDYLLSSENLIQVTRDVLKDSVDVNVFNLELILIFESIALVLLCLFLILVVRIIVQSYKRLFRALMKIEDFHINFRLSQLQNTKASLEVDIEDKRFGYEKSDDIEEVKQRPKGMVMNKKKKQKTGFITRDDRFSVTRLIIYLAKYVGVTLIFITVPSALFFLSLSESIANFDVLDKADDQLSLTTKAEYQVRMLMTNFYMQMLFQNTTKMLIRNQLPATQLDANLETMNNIHDGLLTVFFEGGDTIADPIIESMLKDTICSWLPTDDPTLNELCPVATNGEKIGILSLDANLITTSIGYIERYLKEPTLDNANDTISNYQKAVRPLMITLEGAFKFLNKHILDNSLEEVDVFTSRTTYLFLGILATIALSAGVIYFLSIKQFTFLDMGRGKILKLIPYHFITENKALDFYLNKDFDKKKYSIKGMS